MNILVFDTDPWIKMEYLQYLKKAGHTLIQAEQDHDKKQIQGIITYRTHITKDLLDQHPNTTHVMRVGVGLDRVDLKECKKRNIKVLNTPGANADSVADLAIRGTLTCKRHAIPAYEMVQTHTEHIRFPYEGDELSACTAGFVGFGNIGKKIYQRLKGFGITNFLAHDPYIDQTRFPEVKLEREKNEVLKKSDIIYIVLPLTTETKDLIDKDFLTQCKNTVCLINTARGGVCEEKALYSFLKTNPKASYHGDVRKQEPHITVDLKRLTTLKNCVLTPHIGAHTTQAQKRMHTFDTSDLAFATSDPQNHEG